MILYGEIFVKCNLKDCIYIDEEFAEKVRREDKVNFDCGDYSPGRYAWIIDDIEYIEPIKAVGHLSIWNYNPE